MVAAQFNEARDSHHEFGAALTQPAADGGGYYNGSVFAYPRLTKRSQFSRRGPFRPRSDFSTNRGAPNSTLALVGRQFFPATKTAPSFLWLEVMQRIERKKSFGHFISAETIERAVGQIGEPQKSNARGQWSDDRLDLPMRRHQAVFLFRW